MNSTRTIAVWRSACVIAVACWGYGASSGGTFPPGGGSTAATTSESSCTAALAASTGGAVVAPFNVTPEAAAKRDNSQGRTKGDVRDALWKHRAPRGRERVTPKAETELVRPAATEDAGEIAVIEDDGSIFLSANAFDLANTGLRFRRSDAGYEVTRIDAAFRTSLGGRLTLGDDDTIRVALPAALGAFGGSFSEAFVNSDGNITFGAGDAASTSRSVGRFLGGSPRVAAFFADLDPSVGGRVFAQADAAALTVTWCAVPGFDDPNTVSAQVTMQADGTVEVLFGDVQLREAVVGISPGDTQSYTPVDLSMTDANTLGTGAVGERFSDSSEADLVSAAQRFYRAHPDIYDQLVFWGDARLIPVGEAFAQEFTVANTVQGIGMRTGGSPREFGSARRLQSVVNMDRILKYPADPSQKFLGQNTVLSLLGQESGHRWLAFTKFFDANRLTSGELLGRDDAHWSFFLDSDASVMEGNDIEALGGGTFRTAGAVQRYSPLDQYIMGLIPPEQVPPFFYVESPVNVAPERDRSSSPQVGVTFSGTRRDVLIEDVLSAMGPRVPSSVDAQKTWRQAWIFLTQRGSTPSAADIARIDTWRTAWETFFLQATDGRMRVDATLR